MLMASPSGSDAEIPLINGSGSTIAMVDAATGAIEQRSSRPTALDAMNPAPQTIRPDMTPRLAAMLLRARSYLLVTTVEGRYLGRYVSGARGQSWVHSRPRARAGQN